MWQQVRRKLNRTANAHTSDAGLGQSSSRISGAAYTAGVYNLRLIPGIYMKASLKSHILIFNWVESERQSFNREVGSGVPTMYSGTCGDKEPGSFLSSWCTL